jgi:hypothetical protein
MLVHGFIVNLVAGTCMAAVATPISGHNLPYPPVAATPLWLVLLTTLGPPLLTALLGYIAGIATQRSIDKKQRERDELAHMRATAEGKKTSLSDAYTIIRRAVGVFEDAFFAIEQSAEEEREEVISNAHISTESALEEAQEAVSAYMFINKEEEMHTCLTSMHQSFSKWLRQRSRYSALQKANSTRVSVDPTTDMPYKMVEESMEEFKAKRDQLLTLAKVWEKELPE